MNSQEQGDEPHPSEHDCGTEYTSPSASPLVWKSPTFTDSQSTSSSLPSVKKTRTRKTPTKEISPEDTHALIALGMSPFMPGLDSISNQNRLVRNENILARHVARLQASFSTSESKHAQRDQDIYRILTDHTTLIDNLRGRNVNNTNVSTSCACSCACSSPSSILTNPEFMALLQGHVEMREALNALIAKVSASSASTKRTLEKLTDDLFKLKSELIPVQGFQSPEDVPSTSSSSQISSPSIGSPHTSNLGSSTRLPAGGLRSTPLLHLPGASEAYQYREIHTIKRKRRGSEAAVKRSMDPSLLSTNPHFSITSTTQSIQSAAYDTNPPMESAMIDVVYGPIINTSTRPRTSATDTATAEEAMQNIGLSSGMIHSVRPAPAADHPDCLVIRFLKYDYASRFVDLIGIGLDGYPERKAFLWHH